jgi:hypothetical protein
VVSAALFALPTVIQSIVTVAEVEVPSPLDLSRAELIAIHTFHTFPAWSVSTAQ